MNAVINRLSMIPVQKLNSPDRRKMSNNGNMNDTTPIYFKSKNPMDRVSFTSGSKLDYMA